MWPWAQINLYRCVSVIITLERTHKLHKWTWMCLVSLWAKLRFGWHKRNDHRVSKLVHPPRGMNTLSKFHGILTTWCHYSLTVYKDGRQHESTPKNRPMSYLLADVWWELLYTVNGGNSTLHSTAWSLLHRLQMVSPAQTLGFILSGQWISANYLTMIKNK